MLDDQEQYLEFKQEVVNSGGTLGDTSVLNNEFPMVLSFKLYDADGDYEFPWGSKSNHRVVSGVMSCIVGFVLMAWSMWNEDWGS